MTERILRLRDVIAHTGLSRSTIYNYIARNEFPKPRRLGARTTGWIKSEVQDWILSRNPCGSDSKI